MIICVKCGTDNEDSSPQCAKCGRKLQSGRGAAPERPDMVRPGEPDEADYSFEPGERRRHLYLRHVEPWIYVLVVLGGLAASLRSMSLWPLYVLAPVVAVIAWMRRI
jgi:hypothetical protein